MKRVALLPLVLLLSSCLGQKPPVLPAEKCTQKHQEAYVANCTLGLQLACEKEPGMCLSPASVCLEAVEALCPVDR